MPAPVRWYAPASTLTGSHATRAQFLDSKDKTFFDQRRENEEDREPAFDHRRPSDSSPRMMPKKTPEDAVWVDCFYYGFYMEKAKLPAFQASLRQKQASQKAAGANV